MTGDQPTLPLTCDLETLEQLLFECSDVDGAMLLSELDGYLAGLLVSPHPTAQDIGLREIWGGGEFPGQPERCALLTRLVLTRKAEIASELLQGDMAYLPIFDTDDNSNEVLWELWIEGFARAVVLSDKEWDVLFDTGDEDLAAAAMGILMYVARAGGVEVGDAPLDEDVPPEVMIPYLVETLYRCQNGLPRIVMDTPWEAPMQPVVRSKIGRNSPCPCGSGKKFKKCCGAN